MAESIDKARLGLHMQVELFDDGCLTITDTSDDPYLPTFTNIRAAGAARLLDFLLVHKERLSRYTAPEYTEEEIRHAQELMETGITDITGMVMRRLEEE